MDELFREMTATLSQAQQAVEDELERLMKAPVPDMDRLAHLGRSVGEFSCNADSLLVMMLERDAPADMIDTAGTLADFFEHAKDQLSRRMVRQA